MKMNNIVAVVQSKALNHIDSRYRTHLLENVFRFLNDVKNITKLRLTFA